MTVNIARQNNLLDITKINKVVNNFSMKTYYWYLILFTYEYFYYWNCRIFR